MVNFQELNNNSLYDIALGKTRLANVSDESEVRKNASKELLRRHTAGAYTYQNLMLEAWLDRLKLADQLPFNLEEADFTELSALLAAVLNNPLSLYEHKMRCCLLINKLSPVDNIKQILEIMINNIAAGNIHQDAMNVFGPVLDNDLLFKIVRGLRAKLVHPQSTQAHKNEAMVALDVIAPYLTVRALCQDTIRCLMPQALREDINVQQLAATAIHALQLSISRTQGEVRLLPMLQIMRGRAFGQRQAGQLVRQNVVQMVRDQVIVNNLNLMGQSNQEQRTRAVRVLSACAPLGSETLRDQVRGRFIAELSNPGQGVAESAALGLGHLVINASPARRNEIIQALLQGAETYEDVGEYAAVITSLGRIARSDAAPALDPITLGAIVRALIESLDLEDIPADQLAYGMMERYRTVRDLAAIAPRVILEVRELILQSFINILSSADESTLVQHAVVSVLADMAPYLTQADYSAIIKDDQSDLLCAVVRAFKEESQEIGYIGNHVAILLSVMAPRASQSQCEELLAQLVTLLMNTDELDESVPLVMATMFALQAIRPYVSEPVRMQMIRDLRDEKGEDEALEVILWALGENTPLTDAGKETRHEMIMSLFTKLNLATHPLDRHALVTIISAFMPVLTDRELGAVVQMQGELSYEERSLQLIAQTQLHAKALLLNPPAQPHQVNRPF